MSLDKAIQKFRDWALVNPGRYGEWECDYLGWGYIYREFTNFFEHTEFAKWSLTETQDILYAIARDNESEILIDKIAERKECLLALAEAAIEFGEHDAKWQIASRLGEIEGCTDRVEKYLIKFLNDRDEYVRRRALKALAQRGSNQTEAWVEVAWKSGHEYQRIMALHALHLISSSRLQDYIALAMEDGRQYLVKNAMDLRSKSD